MSNLNSNSYFNPLQKELWWGEPKYELTDNTLELCRKDCLKLHRIRALRDFGDVKTGDFGGYIEKEENLSHAGTCWVYGNSQVYDDAYVGYDAQVGTSQLNKYDPSWDIVKIFGRARVCGKARIHDANIFGNAVVYGDAEVSIAAVFGNARVNGGFSSDGRFKWKPMVSGKACIWNNALITRTEDYWHIDPVCGFRDDLTFYRTKVGIVCVVSTLWSWTQGTLDGLVNWIKAHEYGDTCEHVYQHFIEVAKLLIKVRENDE